MPTETAVLEALRQVQDPDLRRDIVALGFVKELRIDDGDVSFAIELTTPACPVKDQMKAAAESAVRAVAGVRSVDVTMTARVTASRPLMGKGAITGVKNVLAVSSGKGGVGKSTVSVNLACALQQEGARVGILDADIYGPDVPLMLGVAGQPEKVVDGDGNQRMRPLSAHGLQVMSIGFLVAEDQPVIWRGPMVHSAMRSFLHEVAWDNLDYLVVDLPPGTGDAQLSLSQQAHLTGAIIVTTPQDVAVLDVRKAIRMFQTVKVPVLGVVENMAWFQPPGSSDRFEIFGSGGGARVQTEFDIPLLGQVPISLDVRSGGDSGQPIVLARPDDPAAAALRGVARLVAARISTVNAE